jgi:hypothetical protein
MQDLHTFARRVHGVDRQAAKMDEGNAVAPPVIFALHSLTPLVDIPYITQNKAVLEATKKCIKDHLSGPVRSTSTKRESTPVPKDKSS